MTFNQWISSLALFAFLAPISAFGESDGSVPQKTAATADQQGTSPVEAEVTRKIREALMKDPSLSMAAKNVTVVTQGQVVTLRGTVPSPAEKMRIDRIAKETAGTNNVVNATKVK